MIRMLLTIDIGNTNITLGTYNNRILGFTARLATDTKRTEDEYAIDIKNLLSLYHMSPDDIEDCIISSVVPSVYVTVIFAPAKFNAS